MAAPENHVTKARATPKTPNWSSLLVTTSGIQIVAEAAYAAVATPVITPVGDEHSRPHLAEQQEPRAEPPQPRRRRQRRDGEEPDLEPTVEVVAETTEQRRGDQHRHQAHQATPVHGGAAVARSPPRMEVDALQRRRERAGEEDRQHEPEHAGRLAHVVGRRERFPGDRQRVAAQAEPERDGGDRAMSGCLRA